MAYQFVQQVLDMEPVEGIGDSHRLVLLAVAEYADPKTGQMWRATKELARRAWRSERRVQYCLRDLEAAGLIRRTPRYAEGRGRRSTVIQLTLPRVTTKRTLGFVESSGVNERQGSPSPDDSTNVGRRLNERQGSRLNERQGSQGSVSTVKNRHRRVNGQGVAPSTLSGDTVPPTPRSTPFEARFKDLIALDCWNPNQSQAKASVAWERIVRAGDHNLLHIIEGAARYAAFVQAEDTPPRYRMSLAAFLDNNRFLDPWKPQPSAADAKADLHRLASELDAAGASR